MWIGFFLVRKSTCSINNRYTECMGQWQIQGVVTPKFVQENALFNKQISKFSGGFTV